MKKLIQKLEESRSRVPNDKIAKINKMTELNDNGGAILEGAKMLGNKSIADRVKLVMKLHILEGGMPNDLMNYRHGLYKELMYLAKKKLSKDNYEKFHGAF